VRLEIFAAVVNGGFMLWLIGFINWEAIQRLATPQPVVGGAVMAVAALGLLVNLAVAWVLHHGGDNLNTRAAFLHVLLESVPFHTSVDSVALDLSKVPGVRRVHDLHVWTLSSGQVGLTAHLELDSFTDWDRILTDCRAALDRCHGIRHVTLQPEIKE
jgi:cobalt-zinc-cadmium efflux system protein